MTSAPAESTLTERDVLNYLRAHPDMLSRHPELLAVLTPPGRPLGEGVVDFQQFQLKNLQVSSREMSERYNLLVGFCRDNLSVQTQVHDAVLRLIRARSLSALLEVLTLDLVGLFDVDVVRLAVESGDSGSPQEITLLEANEPAHSGIVLVPPGVCSAALTGRKAQLVEDALHSGLPALEIIFADCTELARSCALLALDIKQIGQRGEDRSALLAFGTRHPGRFQPGQGAELMTFLARIVAHQLSAYLENLDI